MTAVEILAERAVAPVTPDELERLRVLTLTNIAAGIGELGRAGALLGVLPFGAPASPADAAFLLAAQLHARTQDDFLPAGRSHLGAVALAATLAVAERAQRPLFESLVAGYRTMSAVSVAYAPIAQARGLRPSSVFGPLGAAAAAGIALGLDAAGLANALALAAAACGGTNQAWISGTDEWMLELGVAARAGVEAALFTAVGAVGSPVALEGAAGWGAALFGEPGAPRLAALLDGPEAASLKLDAVAIKPYPISGIAQVPTALAGAAHAQLAGGPIDAVTVAMSASELAYPGSANRGPFTSRSDALMSVAFCVACGLLDGRVPLARLERPDAADIAAVIDRIVLEPREDLADGDVALQVNSADRVVRLHGGSDAHLHPSWDDLRGDVAGLAARSEAPTEQVERARATLQSETPDCRLLRKLLEEVRT